MDKIGDGLEVAIIASLRTLKGCGNPEKPNGSPRALGARDDDFMHLTPLS